MKKYSEIPENCPLFTGIDCNQLHILLKCLGAAEKQYAKNDFVFHADEIITSIGIVLSGSVHVVQEDFWGNRTILARIETGGIFGESFSCVGSNRLPVSVIAAETTGILLMDAGKIITTCTSACAFHTVLVRNMVGILATKNVALTQKMEFVTQRTTREKLMAYLSAEARRAGSNAFEIPFNRQELAEYLAVDRSAMSNALSKMRDDKILTFHRNRFELVQEKTPPQ